MQSLVRGRRDHAMGQVLPCSLSWRTCAPVYKSYRQDSLGNGLIYVRKKQHPESTARFWQLGLRLHVRSPLALRLDLPQAACDLHPRWVPQGDQRHSMMRALRGQRTQWFLERLGHYHQDVMHELRPLNTTECYHKHPKLLMMCPGERKEGSQVTI